MQKKIVLVLTILLCTGCLPATKVRKNPGDSDRGVRYYRPKPYLAVTPLTDKGGKPVDGYVSIQMEMLPDFSEEYSIQVRSGLGNNKTDITLYEGWRLDAIDVTIDSKFDENVKAVADAVKAIPLPTALEQKRAKRVTAEASNVPMGYYEAVLSECCDGKKRLYGFRYVGFMPFSACPVESCGSQFQNCQTADVYALLYEDNRMVFRPLHEANHIDFDKVRLIEEVAPPAVVGEGVAAERGAADDDGLDDES